MKLAEYNAKVFAVLTENGVNKIIVHATDGTKVVIVLSPHQFEIAERALEAPCA